MEKRIKKRIRQSVESFNAVELGAHFGTLVLIEKKGAYWDMRCDCGKTVSLARSQILASNDKARRTCSLNCPTKPPRAPVNHRVKNEGKGCFVRAEDDALIVDAQCLRRVKFKNGGVWRVLKTEGSKT